MRRGRGGAENALSKREGNYLEKGMKRKKEKVDGKRKDDEKEEARKGRL